MKNKSGNKKIAIAAAVSVIVLAAVAVFPMVSALSNTKIYDGVSVGEKSLAKMSKSEAEKEIEKYFEKNSDFSLQFECGDDVFEIPSAEILPKIKAKSVANEAYGVGRGHSFLKNYSEILSVRKKGFNVPLEVSFDKDRLVMLVNEKIADKIKDPVPPSVEIGEKSLIVTNGTPGEGINDKKLFKEAKKRLENLSCETPIVLKIETIQGGKVDADEFVKEYLRDAKDAVYTKTDDGFYIEPEVVGISFDEDEARKIIEDNKTGSEPYEIPALITRPSVTAKILEDKYVNKIIATYTTSFAGSSANRCANIALAAKKIDGYVINPGKRFSYNAVVGPRTAATGFKTAHVYVGTQVTDGIGGGICQVSSTLYNAAVLADMKIVSRTNHSMPVGYVPLGRDATVSYGSIDFVFENDKSYPVSVKAAISGTNLTVSIVGSKTEDYTVSIVTDSAKTVPYQTVKTEDNTIPEGQVKVITKGSNGSTVNSYRVYKKNGVEYSRKFEAKSTYSSTTEKIAVGTLKPAPEPEVKEPPVPEITEETAPPAEPAPEDTTDEEVKETFETAVPEENTTVEMQ